jgi:hypothetical protein
MKRIDLAQLAADGTLSLAACFCWLLAWLTL